jgi:RNA polymerase sigma-70 factor (ECF subfamily)
MHLEEYKSLVSTHKNRLFRLASWMLHHAEDAEDVVQEVFLKIWDIRDELDKYRSLEALLVQMTRNLCLNKIKARRPMWSEEQLMGISSLHTSPDVQMVEAEEVRLVQKAIKNLPEQQQVVLQLRAVEGMDTKEIAVAIAETENNVRVLLSRARKSLKVSFSKNYSHG